MLDYVALKAADAALDPPIADPAAAAVALNAQTTVLQPRAFASLDALKVLLASGEWPKVIVRSEVRPLDAAAGAAICAVALLQAQGMIDAANPVLWNAFGTAIGALVAAGDISPGSVAAIGALRTPTVPVWPVVLTADDIVAARELA